MSRYVNRSIGHSEGIIDIEVSAWHSRHAWSRCLGRVLEELKDTYKMQSSRLGSTKKQKIQGFCGDMDRGAESTVYSSTMYKVCILFDPRLLLDELAAWLTVGRRCVNVCINRSMLSNIVECFEWPLVRKALYMLAEAYCWIITRHHF